MDQQTYDQELQFIRDQTKKTMDLIPHMPLEVLVETTKIEERVIRTHAHREAVISLALEHLEKLDPDYDLTEVKEIQRQSQVIIDDTYKLINAAYAEIAKKQQT